MIGGNDVAEAGEWVWASCGEPIEGEEESGNNLWEYQETCPPL